MNSADEKIENSPEKTPEKTPGFKSLGLDKTILRTLEGLGHVKPTPIQLEAIPKILGKRDVIGQAQTGTGKTAAFLLPSLNLIKDSNEVSLLVITPTRELTQQVDREFFSLSKGLSLRSAAIFGGSPIMKQIKRLKEGVQAIVATPGRLLDLLQNKRIPNFNPSIVVLDEADEMLDMGFLEDIQKIFEYLPEEKQTLLFSATMSQSIKKLAQNILINPVHVNTTSSDVSKKNIQQDYYIVKESEKELALKRLVETLEPEKAIIFCRTKREVDDLFKTLNKLGLPVDSLHGDMEQAKRQKSISAFKNGECRYLVATDIAGRGLNILDISHVINYHMPFSEESYTHRIGRTGRAGNKGVAITFASPMELKKKSYIIKKNEKNIRFCTIPTLEEMKKKQVKNFIDGVKKQGLENSSREILKTLEEEMSLEDISLSLISSMTAKKGESTGPNKIGVSLEALKSGAYESSPRSRNRGNYRGGKRSFSSPRSPRPRKTKNY
jgi:ATP-dependent RNA helicase DeaD